MTGPTSTADDVRRRVGEPDHPAHWGGFLATSRAGLIEGWGAPVGDGVAAQRPDPKVRNSLDNHIAKLVAAASELTFEQREKLRTLLRGSS